jgi:hypothetical protein
MANDYSGEDLLQFLDHAADKGLMPAATARALAVASRSVLDILSADERADLRRLDVGAVVKRFTNKRARDFNPASLKEYGRRFQRAVSLFIQWRDDSATFSVPTRATARSRSQARTDATSDRSASGPYHLRDAFHPGDPQTTGSSGYQSSFPVRAGVVVTISNIPADLTKPEAERLAQFVRVLPLE